jgi:hypothetical protein
MRIALRAALATLLLAATPSLAQEGRGFNPIARPAARTALPEGAVRVSPPVPVARERIEAAVALVAKAWSERRVETVLAPGFARRTELADAMQTKVPRDATLRVTAIQGWQVLDQWRQGGLLVSRVSVTVRTQVEFNDAAGFQVRDGTNEFVMTLRGREAGP